MTMPAACQDLDRFVDGELGTEGTQAFRHHLGVCPACPDRLARVVAVDILAEEAMEAEVEGRPADVERTAERPAAAAPVAVTDELAARRSRRWLTSAAVVFAAAAAAVVVFMPGGRPPDLAVLVRDKQYRVTAGRLAYAGFAQHRPLVRERGDAIWGAAATGREQLLAALERRDDHHGLAIAALLEGRYHQAAQRLARAHPTPAVLVDGAALAIERGDARAALALANQALATGDAAIRSAALWNRAVALAMLGSGAEAIAIFDKVAALGEPGWAEEARRRASDLK